jgi:transmembrane sensor
MSADVKRETGLDAAAEWFALRRSGRMTLQELFELEVWLETDPSHLAAYKAIANSWALTRAVASDPEILQLREEAEGRAGARVLKVAGSTAAVLALLALIIYAGGDVWRDAFSPVLHQHVQTALGETHAVTLLDGSKVTLDSDTSLDLAVSWRQRAVSLNRGQAFFRVAKDVERPFVVTAAGNAVTATGTAFDIRIDKDRFMVLLTEGHLHVQIPATESEPAEQSDLIAGHQLISWAGGERSVSRLNAQNQARVLSWTSGTLSFVRTPLGRVTDELNRYSKKKVAIAPELASTPIDGVFRTGDVEGFVRLLVKGKLARVQNDTNLTITLVPRKIGPLAHHR